MRGFLYPIEEGKEICLFERIYLNKDINAELTKTSSNSINGESHE